MAEKKAKIGKVIPMGDGGCVVTLPSSWCARNGVKVGGDVVKITDNTPALTILPLGGADAK